MHNVTKAGIILGTQIRNKTIFKKRIPYLFFYYQFSLRLSPYANNVQLLIRFWLLAFNNKHNFLLFFLNRATGGFIFIFLILIFLKLCTESNCSLRRKIAEYTDPSNLLYNSLSSYFAEFFWKTGLWILAFKCDIYDRA